MNHKRAPQIVQNEGLEAYLSGKSESDNPYKSNRLFSGFWLYGFSVAKQRAEQLKAKN